MIQLTRQKHFQSVQKLPFCYFCRRSLEEGQEINKDHVPPQVIFATSDRQPLILRTHKDCNEAHKVDDETIGQLIALSRGYTPSLPKNRKLRFAHFPEQGMSAVTDIEIEHVVFGWVMGFHAALYKQPMPDDARASIHTPFAKGHLAGSKILFEPTIPDYYKIVDTVKQNRDKSNVDRISCNYGKMVYECVWSQFSTGHWFCCFTLNIYNWERVGQTPDGPRQCAGCYTYFDPSIQAPKMASKGYSPLSAIREVVLGA
jgi:hypothetical protein